MQEAVQLLFRPGSCVLVRELTGEDERSVDSTATAAALRLLDGVLLDHTGRPGDPGFASGLVAADRDRLLSALYRITYGDCVESTARCESCGKPFDLDFSLADLCRSLGVPGGAGPFRTALGTAFRLPTGAEECAAAKLGPEQGRVALLRQCVIERAEGDTDESIQEAMEQAAPILGVDLDMQCPECGQLRRMRFEIQNYFLSALLRERRRLLEDVHALATAYGWSLGEVLSLARSERRFMVDLIDRSGHSL